MNSAPAAMIYQTIRSALAFASGKKPSKSKGGFTAPQILLQPSPSLDWDLQFEKLLKSEFLKSKYNRRRRLTEKWAYLTQHLPELIDSPMPGTTVIDIGPGPGEFLECCRALGYQIQGVDAACGEGGMGNEYLQLSRLLTQRQDLGVEYCGLQDWMDQRVGGIPEESVTLINSQGSIEQACQHLMAGVPHHEHHDCRRLEWQSGPEMQTFFNGLMSTWQSWLRPGGIIMIYANGAANTEVYTRVVERAAEDAGDLQLVYRNQRIHKWMKRSNG